MGYTPMMQQYFKVKEQYPDCILFYRLGDFYEMFFDDAVTASKELELTLTGKDCGMEDRAPMCGVPYHSSEGYISKLITKGYKVAICEQMENPATAKGLVKRDVIRIVTPSTITNDSVVDSSKNNFLVAIYKDAGRLGLAFLDFSTGELCATVILREIYENLITELARYMPSEALLSEAAGNDKDILSILNTFSCYVTCGKGEYFENAADINEPQFSGKCKLYQNEISYPAIAGAVRYILETQKTDISHINCVSYYTIGEFMDIDPNTRRNLELTETMRSKSKKGSLLWVLDQTETAMGGRRLRKWIDQPLINCGLINKRLAGVEELQKDVQLRSGIKEILSSILDLERLIGRVVCKTANARDLVALKNSMQVLPQLSFSLAGCRSGILSDLCRQIDALEDVYEIIERSIVDAPPITLRDGGLIKEGFNERLDELHLALTEGKGWLTDIETTEREKTGIKNLKIGFNKVFGYYIEVSKSNVSRVPETYIRKQTLTTGERYITQKLKEIEDLVLGSEEKSVKLEYSIFEEIRDKVGDAQERVQNTARAIGILDCLISFAEVAARFNYCKPVVDVSGHIDIKEGRHPVVERLSDEMFVPNDTNLNDTTDRFLVITGPNMAGKSTYMRQVAILVLMAQIGSFVPASSANIGIVDRIFTRVGASDDLAAGQSTFMVEMSEVAHILKNATANSLIIYDEIGRGTSTYDGLAIAWAVAEFTANKKTCGAKTLFATHYHELTRLETLLEGVKNYCVAVKERGDDIIFLRKIIRGGTDDSYGVEVAKLAGIPARVIKRAKEILTELEKSKPHEAASHQTAESAQQEQPTLGDQLLRNITEKVKQIDLNTITPIEAMNLLYQLKKEIDTL